MKISSVNNFAFGRLQDGILEKCKEDYNSRSHEGDALYDLWHNGEGLEYIANSDVFILSDTNKKDEYGHRIFSLDLVENDTLEIKKPIHQGELFDFLSGFTHNGFCVVNRDVVRKMDTIKKMMSLLK